MEDEFDFVPTLPGLMIAKDNYSLYLNISQDFAKLLGWKNPHQCLGKTDYDIPSKASKFADEFIKMDKIVVDSAKKMLALDIQSYANGWRLILVERNPILNNNQTVRGLFNRCIDVSETNLFANCLDLYRLDNQLYGKSLKPVSYVLDGTHSPFPLTEKQETCLFLLIRGKTVKTIAKILKISPRTVESHLEAIKKKLYCKYNSELIEKTINSGFLYYIPEYIRKNELEKIIKA